MADETKMKYGQQHRLRSEVKDRELWKHISHVIVQAEMVINDDNDGR